MATFDFSITDPSTYWPTAKEIGFAAIGAGTPEEMIVANLVVSVVAVVSSLVSLGATLFILLITLPLLAIGVLRAVSTTVDGYWPIGS